jgi:D-sedoheptulose 7-phosphate isomerase
MDYQQDIKDYIALEQQVLGQLDVQAIDAAMQLLDQTRLAGGDIYICGNGGSAATASHYQNDFNKGISEYITPKFRFRCLNDNVATIMAIANDIGYEEVFSFQLQDNLRPQDIFIGISGSGNSENVLRAARYAKQCGNKVIAIVGYEGGQLKDLADIVLWAPIKSMQISEDIHMIFDHLMMSLFYRSLAHREHLQA